MSRYGMQMPGGQIQRGKEVDVFTGLLFLAAVALLGAVGFVGYQAGKVGNADAPFPPIGLHDQQSVERGDIALPPVE